MPEREHLGGVNHATRKLSPQPDDVNITQRSVALEDGTAITLYESPGNAITSVIQTNHPDGTVTVSFKITSFEFDEVSGSTAQAHAQLAVNLASLHATNGELILDTVGNGGGRTFTAVWFQQFFFGGISEDFQLLEAATQWANRKTNSELLEGLKQARQVVASYNQIYDG